MLQQAAEATTTTSAEAEDIIAEASGAAAAGNEGQDKICEECDYSCKSLHGLKKHKIHKHKGDEVPQPKGFPERIEQLDGHSDDSNLKKIP